MTAPVKFVVAILVLMIAADVVLQHPTIVLLAAALALIFFKGKHVGRKEEAQKQKEKSWKRF